LRLGTAAVSGVDVVRGAKIVALLIGVLEKIISPNTLPKSLSSLHLGASLLQNQIAFAKDSLVSDR
jgi:hypothetical protein